MLVVLPMLPIACIIRLSASISYSANETLSFVCLEAASRATTLFFNSSNASLSTNFAFCS
jgi:hypothetical protein